MVFLYLICMSFITFSEFKENLSENLHMKFPYLLSGASPVICRVLEGFRLSSSNTVQPSPPLAQ